MAEYVKHFKDIYPDGWVNGPTPKTPINNEALNQYTDICLYLEDYLEKNEVDPYLNWMSDFHDVDIPWKYYNYFLCYDGEKWVCKDINIPSAIPSELTEMTSSGGQYHGYPIYYYSGQMILNGNYCYTNCKFQWQYNSSSGWNKVFKGFPKPKNGETLYSYSPIVTDNYMPMFGSGNDRMIRLLPDGDLEIYNPESGGYYSFEFHYLIEQE